MISKHFPQVKAVSDGPVEIWMWDVPSWYGPYIEDDPNAEDVLKEKGYVPARGRKPRQIPRHDSL